MARVRDSDIEGFRNDAFLSLSREAGAETADRLRASHPRRGELDRSWGAGAVRPLRAILLVELDAFCEAAANGVDGGFAPDPALAFWLRRRRAAAREALEESDAEVQDSLGPVADLPSGDFARAVVALGLDMIREFITLHDAGDAAGHLSRIGRRHARQTVDSLGRSRGDSPSEDRRKCWDRVFSEATDVRGEPMVRRLGIYALVELARSCPAAQRRAFETLRPEAAAADIDPDRPMDAQDRACVSRMSARAVSSVVFGEPSRSGRGSDE